MKGGLEKNIEEEERGEEEVEEEGREEGNSPVLALMPPTDTEVEASLSQADDAAVNVTEGPSDIIQERVEEQAGPTLSEVEDQASEEKHVESSSMAEVPSSKYEHLWEGCNIPEETKGLLRAYARLDCGPFMVIEKTMFMSFRKAEIESLGELLSSIVQWSFARLESAESKQLESTIAELEGFGVPCKLLKSRLADLCIVKPSETRAVLSQKTQQYSTLSNQQSTLLQRRERISKQIKDLHAEIQRLEDEDKSVEALSKAAEHDLAKVDEERTRLFDLIAPHMTQANPVAALVSVRDFFLS